MKFKPTPLLLLSIALLFFGVYCLFFATGYKNSWQPVFGVISILSCAGSFLLYRVLRAVLVGKLLVQICLEMGLLASVLFYFYKSKGNYEFQLPHNYKGYVMIVYNVKDKPELSLPLFKNKIEIKVPQSGVMLTSSNRQDDISYPAVFMDSSFGEIEKLPPSLRRYDIPSEQNLKCNDNNYPVDIWFIKNEPSYNSQEDSVNGLDPKLQSICQLINK